MKYLALILLVFVVSCNKDKNKPKPSEPSPVCDCVEQHEQFITGMGWAIEYVTDTTQLDCSMDNNTYVWVNPEHTKRYIVNCQ